MNHHLLPLLFVMNMCSTVMCHEDSAQDVYVMTTWVVLSVILLVYLVMVMSTWSYVRRRPPIPFVFIIFLIFVPPVFLIFFIYWWLFLGLFTLQEDITVSEIEVTEEPTSRISNTPRSRRDMRV